MVSLNFLDKVFFFLVLVLFSLSLYNSYIFFKEILILIQIFIFFAYQFLG